MAPRIQYARSGDVHIAYATVGEGPFDDRGEHTLKGIPERRQVFSAAS